MRTFYNFAIYQEIFKYNSTDLKLPMYLAEKPIFSKLAKYGNQQNLFWNQECTIWAWKNEEGPKSLGGISSNTWDETLLYHKPS